MTNATKENAEVNLNITEIKDLLAKTINNSMRMQNIKGLEASKKTGFDSSDFSKIKSHSLKRFTINRLIRILGKLEPKIEMTMNFRGGLKRNEN